MRIDVAGSFESWARQAATGFSGDRSETVGSSEIGDCARKVAYRKHNTPKDNDYEESSGFLVRGNVMEDGALAPFMRHVIEAAGGRLLFSGQSDQLRLVSKKKYASATPDGLAIDMPKDALADYGVKDIGPSRQILVEFKSIDPRFKEGNLPKAQHVDQVNFAMGLARGVEVIDPDDGTIFVAKPEYALIVYMDASDYSKINAFAVKFDVDVYKAQCQRAAQIMTCETPEAMRPEGKVEGGGPCRYCEFATRCLGYTPLIPRVVQLPPPEVVSAMKAKATEVKTWKTQAADAEKNAKLAEADLKEMLIDAGTKFVDAPSIKLIWSSSDGRKMTDTKAMANKLTSLGVDVSQFEKQSKGSDTLRIEFVDAIAN